MLKDSFAEKVTRETKTRIAHGIIIIAYVIIPSSLEGQRMHLPKRSNKNYRDTCVIAKLLVQ